MFVVLGVTTNPISLHVPMPRRAGPVVAQNGDIVAETKLTCGGCSNCTLYATLYNLTYSAVALFCKKTVGLAAETSMEIPAVPAYAINAVAAVAPVMNRIFPDSEVACRPVETVVSPISFP
jgi:hypothetical protein